MKTSILACALVALCLLVVAGSLGMMAAGQNEPARNDPVANNALRLTSQGRQVFRFDTFGDQVFWGDALKLHLTIEGAKLGGVGPGSAPSRRFRRG